MNEVEFEDFVVATFAVQEHGRYAASGVENASSDNGRSFLVSEDELEAQEGGATGTD